MKTPVWTISSLVRYLKNSLENDINIQSILVKGEISNFTNHRSGHLYFSLKDSGSKLNCVMFSSYASKLKITPKEGMQVIVQAKISLYEPQGNLQLYVTDMQSDGIGDLYLQFEELKKKLSEEGLFALEHKKAIPTFPSRIAVISARTGAAIQDVLSIIARRWPLCEVKLYPSLVQGEGASTNIIKCLKEADESQFDIILLVRGGGSLEDLWCFNNEELARTIYHLNTCIVTGVGHETDTTLVDYVSDYRCPTPSAAAEFVTPDCEEIKQNMEHYYQRMSVIMNAKLMKYRESWKKLSDRPLFHNSEQLIQNDKIRLMMVIKSLEKSEKRVNDDRYRLEKKKEKLAFLATSLVSASQHDIAIKEESLERAIDKYIQKNKTIMNENISLLDAFSPLKILQRGYAIAMHDEKAIRSIKEVSVDDVIEVVVNDGNIRAKVMGGKM